jgi:hypothetical protein
LEGRDCNVFLETGFTLTTRISKAVGSGLKGDNYCLTLDRTTIDSKITKISEQFLCAVLTEHKLEELGGVVNELVHQG